MTRYTSIGKTVNADLDDSTQYSTLYSRAGEPVGTFTRRRVLDRSGPVWQLHDTNGNLLRSWRLPRSYQGLVDDAAKTLLRDGGYEEHTLLGG